MSPNGHIYRAAFFGLSRKFNEALHVIAPDDEQLIKDLKKRASCGGACDQGRKPCPCPQACQISAEDEIVSIVKTILGVICGMLALALLLLMSTPVHAAEIDAERNVQAAAIADGATTAIAIGTRAATEGNTILSGSAGGIVGITVAKVVLPVMTRGMPREQRKPVLQIVSALWSAAGAWNVGTTVAVKVGAYAVGWPLAAAVAAGTYVYHKTGRDFDREPEPISAPEADAVLAMAPGAEVMP